LVLGEKIDHPDRFQHAARAIGDAALSPRKRLEVRAAANANSASQSGVRDFHQKWI
jgi:hypothetical protein